MQRVPRCPNTGSKQITVYQFLRKSAEITISKSFLYISQDINDTISLQLEDVTAGSCIHQPVS